MPVVGLRELSRDTRDVIEKLETTKEPVVVTRHGKPIAALTPISEEDAASYALALAPEFVASRERAARSIAAGEGEPVSQVLAELDLEDETELAERREGELPIPPMLIEWVATVAARATEVAVVDVPTIRQLNLALADVLLSDAVATAVERVRIVNENIAESASGDPSIQWYATELESVTQAERLAARPIPRSAHVAIRDDS